MNEHEIREQITGKKVLITGGTGSFGHQILRDILPLDPACVHIYSRDEKKQDDMRQFYNNDRIKFFIGDVRDKYSVDYVMYGVDYVFHAAALKQVPSCEFFPIEAVRTNVLGCENVLNAALENNVKRAIVLSTDKAVYPINAMGMSKALSEKVMMAISRNLNSSEMVFCGTRYGNVMASRGSVIPLFIDQIKRGGPLTITDPNMTRYMMSLDGAVDLVLFAYRNGRPGDIFVQKAPAATIDVLAKALLELYNSKCDIRIIGTRHGEKLYETLVNREEMAKAEDLGNYYRIPADTRDLNYNRYFNEGRSEISQIEEYNSHNTHRMSIEETKKMLLELDIIKEDIGI